MAIIFIIIKPRIITWMEKIVEKILRSKRVVSIIIYLLSREKKITSQWTDLTLAILLKIGIISNGTK